MFTFSDVSAPVTSLTAAKVGYACVEVSCQHLFKSCPKIHVLKESFFLIFISQKTNLNVHNLYI